MRIKIRLVIVALSIVALVGCAKEQTDSSVIFDGDFAQTTLEQTFPSADLPRDRDSLLTFWANLDPETRDSLLDTMKEDFSNGVLSLSVYVNESDRLVFAPGEDAGTYTVCVNDGTENWNVAVEELEG